MQPMMSEKISPGKARGPAPSQRRALNPPRVERTEAAMASPLSPGNPYEAGRLVEQPPVHDPRGPGFNAEALDQLMKAAFDDGVAAEANRLMRDYDVLAPLIWEDGHAEGKLRGYREGHETSRLEAAQKMQPALEQVAKALSIASDGKRLSARRREELTELLTAAVDGLADLQPPVNPVGSHGHVHVAR